MSRELTRQEKAAIRSLVKRWCANYDKDIGCLPLDCECYMLGKCWTGAYCRYFRSAVLPLDPVLERSLAVVVIGGGAGWYFKIYRPKKQRAAESEADYGGEYDGAEDYDETAPEDDGPPWDEDGEE